MPTLHIVRQSAFASDDFNQCIQVTRHNDIIVFIDDGCYNLSHTLINTIDSNANIKLNILDKHAQARGITIDKVKYNIINMGDLVQLTLTSSRVITWQ